MSNPFETTFENEFNAADNEQVKEGLLCPFCFTDFKTIVRLQEHFAAVHNDEKEEPKKLSTQLKGFIGKAKKILKNDTFDEVSGLEVSPQREPSYYHVWRESQEIGQTFDHFEYFRNIRDSRIERYVIETNKLLIRLDKLMKDAPTDPEKRKQHEKRCVEWVNDADVKLCPNCAKSFNISRRRHHCRLCGGIMCHNCSQFLEYDYATKLISPTNLQSNDNFLPSPMNSTFTSGLTRRGSNSSLMSIVNSSGDPHIRVCHDCKVLLDRRNQIVEDQVTKPFITHLYDKLKEFLRDADKLTPIFYQMCASFSEGENNYKLRDAQELRFKLMKVAENIDVISRKVANLDVNSETSVNSTQLKVQMNIRLMATQYLRENMIGLPSLPSEEELLKRQQKRREEIQRRIEEEQRQAMLEAEAAMQQQQRSMHLSPSSKSVNSLPKVHSAPSIDMVSPDTGWGPEFTLRTNCDVNAMDPMLVQINIIKNYIKKAREEHKYDEVSILELNLKELEINYMLQQKDDE